MRLTHGKDVICKTQSVVLQYLVHSENETVLGENRKNDLAIFLLPRTYRGTAQSESYFSCKVEEDKDLRIPVNSGSSKMAAILRLSFLLPEIFERR